MSLREDHHGEVGGGLDELEGRRVHRHLTGVLPALSPGHRLQDQQVLPLPDHLGALQVYLDLIGAEDQPLELPSGPGDISVHLCVVEEPLK